MNQYFLGLALLSSTISAAAQTSYSWQHSEVRQAWNEGYRGQGAAIHIHDDFKGSYVWANLDRTNLLSVFECWNYKIMTHGDSVAVVAARTAPWAQVNRNHWDNGSINLQPGKLNIVNASYSFYGLSGASATAWVRSQQVSQLAHTGSAVVVKAAGNLGQNLSVDGAGDVLNLALKGSKAVIFAGALENHGSRIATYRILWWSIQTGGTKSSNYTNIPGNDVEFQRSFLMVGVPSNLTVTGTSYAAPQLSGYAAIVGSKFTRASPEQVVSQLLQTARTDTIWGYHPALHGRGEASLSRALAPQAIR